MKKVIITGITGQDGSFLADFLLSKGYEVYGLVRRKSKLDFGNANHLIGKVKFVFGDVTDYSSLTYLIQRIQPDEVYNLAAQSFVKGSWEAPQSTAEIDGIGVLNWLEAIRQLKPNTKFYQASTSEMFGKVQEVPQNENTPFYPRSPYGVAKLYGHWIVKNYRESYGLFACSGILFNHESERRGEEFVTMKIVKAVKAIKENKQEILELGNVEAKRDWGYAGDYVKAMYLMLQQDEPDDYVISTGEVHSVKDFVNAAFKAVDIDLRWEGTGLDTKAYDAKTNKLLVKTNQEFYRPAEVDFLLGDSTKAKQKLGWVPTVKFDELVKIMVDSNNENQDN